MSNTRAHGRYVGSVSHGLVVGLLKDRAYTRVQLCGLCRKTHVNRSGCPPPESGMLAVGKTPRLPMDVLLGYGELAST
jgi:hypothetical protein